MQAGVGIFFQQEGDGSVVVKTIVSGGSAEREGSVMVGDQILSVDQHRVVGEPLSVLRGLILGPQGSYVKLSFQRKDLGEVKARFSPTFSLFHLFPIPSSLSPAPHPWPSIRPHSHAANPQVHTFDIRLMRGSAEYLQSLTSSKSIEDEIDQLRLQLRQVRDLPKIPYLCSPLNPSLRCWHHRDKLGSFPMLTWVATLRRFRTALRTVTSWIGCASCSRRRGTKASGGRGSSS